MVNVYLILHEHWDPAWAFRRRHTVPLVPRLIERVLEMLRRYPSYKFVLDGQTYVLREYLSRLPPEEAGARAREISRYVREGRLRVGPFYSQIDWNLTDGEVWIRNLLIGHRDSEELGGVMKVGWLIDIFGFPDAAPRVLRGFGITSAFISRGLGVERERVRDAFLWRSSDGSEVLCLYLLESYRNALRLGRYPELAEDRVRGETMALLPYSSTGSTVLLLDGYENMPEADDVVPVVEELNRGGRVGRVVISTPEEYA
ncbi:MAG: hypothetical protein DRO06_03655, partial [Thermoproteota archaeon]